MCDPRARQTPEVVDEIKEKFSREVFQSFFRISMRLRSDLLSTEESLGEGCNETDLD
jgi:hypothetical protein